MAVVPFWMPAKEMLQSLEPGAIWIDYEGGIDPRVLAFISATAYPARAKKKILSPSRFQRV